MDTYYPPGFAFHTKLPVVVFIYGDGPIEIIKNTKNWGHYVSWGQLVVASGFIGITFNHRSSESKLFGILDVASDIQNLIHYVRYHFEELNIDKDSMCVWACSTGVPYLTKVQDTSHEFVRCLVAYYGMMNLQWCIDTHPNETSDEGRENTIRLLKKFSLLYYLLNHPLVIPPMFIAQAGLDDSSINETINQFYTETSARGLRVNCVRHPEEHHGFDILDDDETSMTIIEQALRFLKDHLDSLSKLTGNDK